MLMKYSIIVPCYNTASTLERTIQSIQNCGLNDFEVLLIDDGSKDDTPGLCDHIAESCTNVRCIHKKNGGVSSARNMGMKEAKGEYIWFFDSDDLVDDGSMIHAGQIINDYSPDMLMFGMSFDYYSGKRLYQRMELYFEKEALMAPDELNNAFSELYHDNMLTPCWNKLIRRSVLAEHNIEFKQDMFIMEDFLFSLQALNECRSVYTLPEVIYRYRQGNGRENDRAAARLQRVEDFPGYLKPFEEQLSGHPDVMNALFFSLLRQKLSTQTIDEMRETSKIVCNSKYAASSTRTISESRILQNLKDERFGEIRREFKKARCRSTVIDIIRKSFVYSKIRGAVRKRVKN